MAADAFTKREPPRLWVLWLVYRYVLTIGEEGLSWQRCATPEPVAYLSPARACAWIAQQMPERTVRYEVESLVVVDPGGD